MTQDFLVEGGEGVEFGGVNRSMKCRRTLCTCWGAASSVEGAGLVTVAVVLGKAFKDNNLP
ncbi:MAG: hypothetical protein WAK82_23495 [Streptosporangiaceae bacterium]